MSKTDEIKEWQTQSVKHKIAAVLMMDAKEFSFKPQWKIQSGLTPCAKS